MKESTDNRNLLNPAWHMSRCYAQGFCLSNNICTPYSIHEAQNWFSFWVGLFFLCQILGRCVCRFCKLFWLFCMRVACGVKAKCACKYGWPSIWYSSNAHRWGLFNKLFYFIICLVTITKALSSSVSIFQ
jgi:hypothetical protein